jgi:hypothetical protein
MKRINWIIENDPVNANDKNQNLTHSETLLYINFIVKVTELMGVIFGIAYFCGILWML